MLVRFAGRAIPAISLLAALSCGAAPVTVQDDAHHDVTLAAPAGRIVSLAPHTTELLFDAGAGSKVVGVSQFSDYPAEATKLPQLGGSAGFDIERIVALKPDLIVLWSTGTSAAQIDKFKQLGIPVFESEPHNFADIASSLERLGQLAGTAGAAHQATVAFDARRQQLGARYAHAAPVRLFYQIWHEPLMTLNDSHLVAAAISLCGGQNIFGKLPQLVPTVEIEAVLQANPEVILTGSDAGSDALLSWRKFSQLLAVKRDNLFSLNADTLTRGSPRALDGAEALCKKLELARSRRPNN
ncbi:MAG TPA: cobalamin-binding protein [Burkholderiaceae bacterium]|jgi:iron complex transport system substrate-binding protein